VLAAAGLAAPAHARARTFESYNAALARGLPPARGAPAPARGGVAPAPTHPPAAAGGETAHGEAEGEAAAAPASEGDVLAENGLGSPSCRDAAAVPASAREACAASGFAAAPAPTGDYAFDVHIDTGLAHLSNYFEAAVQDAAQWGWMALVALVRGLLVMLEWCYSLNLLGRSLLNQVAGALRAARASITTPGLALVMSIASALVVYHGLIRRRVAQTLGQVVAMLVMMLAGLWAIADPAGSVGTLTGWVNQASAGALGAVASGTPDHPERTLASEMHVLFAEVITSPWCYMEFGNVRWCRDPRLLDGRLRRAAAKIAREERSLAGSRYPTGRQHQALLSVATLLERARDNGELFLALPANGVARNSINEAGSLLRTLCGGASEATHCVGATAAEAEFRTQHGTWPRVVGLLLIWLGALAMLALFGWIALRLLGAAILSLLLLLMAPAAVLAPALGDGGRGLFRSWATHLLGALTAKLIYSLLLGVVLLLSSLLTALSALGWWAQWFLISAGWWLAFHERHQLLGAARVGDATPWTRSAPRAAAAARRPAGVLERAGGRAVKRASDASVIGVGRRAKHLIAPRARTPTRREGVAREARMRARAVADKQVAAALAEEYGRASERLREAPAMQEAISAKRLQLSRVQRAQQAAEASDADREQAAGGAAADGREARTLAARAQRLQADIDARQGELASDRRLLAEGTRARERDGRSFSETQLRERSRFYDMQAALPDKGRADARGEHRDYPRLAGLAGVSEREWNELDAERRHRAILRIDDELAARASLDRAERSVIDAHKGALGRRERTRAARDFQRAHQAEVRRLGHRTTPAREPPSKLAAWLAHEREQAAKAAPSRTLAQRARAEPAPDAAQEQLERWRRQFGRSGRDRDEE
jgi:hypothetical protein